MIGLARTEQLNKTLRYALMGYVRMGCTRMGCTRMAAALLTVMVTTGCVTPDSHLYRWGVYEDVIYTGYKDPGSSDPVTDAELLAEDMARTEAEGMQVPPGVRVHLGYLYFVQGRDNEARALFEQEREIFPESKVFVDGLLSRMGAQ